MLHVVGVILWFGTIVIDLYFLPAAKRGDVRLKAWTYGIYTRALTLELVGLGLLLAGGIGLLVSHGWWPWDFRWLLIKIVAAIVLILARTSFYVLMYRHFRSAVLPSDEGSLEHHLAVAIAGYDRHARLLGPVTLVGLGLLFAMVFWRPF